MPVNSTHPDYDANLAAWSRARAVIAGEDAVKAAGERFLPRLDASLYATPPRTSLTGAFWTDRGCVAETSRSVFSGMEAWERVDASGTFGGAAADPARRGTQPRSVCVTRIPLRLGKPLPLTDIIVVNLDHYRLDADYKHGIHFTALPTAWVTGFDKTSSLRIGSSTAWVTETPGVTAGFMEFTGQGLTTFERALDRDERLILNPAVD